MQWLSLKCRHVLAGRLKIETDAKLQLPGVGRRSEAERFGRGGGTVASCAGGGQSLPLIGREAPDDVVDAGEIRPVEEVECFKGQLQEHGFFEGEASGEACVETVERLADAGVASHVEGAIRLRATVVVGIEAEQQIERATGTGGEDGREDPIGEQLIP